MPICNIDELKSLLPKGCGVLGLDYGSVVLGVAIADPGLVIGSPLTSITRKKFTLDAEQLVKIIKDRNIGGLIVGLPKNMDGSEGISAQSARAFVRNLMNFSTMPPIPISFWDERLSTAAIERFLIEGDMTRKRRDAVIDKTAAAYILQGALDYLRQR
jgi:putative Holliday junction resolvase